MDGGHDDSMETIPGAFVRFGVTSVAHAQTSADPIKPQTIVTVSFNAAVLQTAEAQKGLNALQTRFAPKQKQLQTLNDEVESLRKQLADGSSNLSDAEGQPAGGHWKAKRKNFSAKLRISKATRKTNQNRFFNESLKRFTLFCRRFHSSMVTPR